MTEQQPEPGGSRDTSVGGLAAEVAKDLSTLVRQEIALAKVEIQDEAKAAGRAAGALGGAGLAGLFAVIFLSLAATGGLAAVMPFGWAALIVAAVWAAVAGGLAITGRARLARVHPAPRRTIETVKEDVRWVTSRNGTG